MDSDSIRSTHNLTDEPNRRQEKAEAAIKRHLTDPSTLSADEIQVLVHGLQVQQSQLEVQNEELRRTLAELELMADKYRDFYDFAPLGYCSVDLKGLISSANLTFVTMLAYNQIELINRPFSQVVLPDDQEIYYLHCKRLNETQSTDSCEIRLVTSAGSQFTAQLTGRSIKNKSGQLIGFQITITDISEQKRQEVELRKLIAAVEQSSSSIVLANLQGNIEYVNPMFTRVTGYSAVDVIGKNPRILQSGKTPKHVYKQMWDAITAGGEWHGEFCNRKKSGEFYWESVSMSAVKDANGHVTHFLAVKDDITQRKQTEQALLQSEQMYHSLLDQAADGIFIADASTKYVLVNEHACQMLGYSREEMLQLTITDIMVPQELTRVPLPFAELRSGQSVLSERTLVRKDGQRIPVEINGKLLVNGQFQGIVRDITERKQAEQTLREREAMLVQMEKTAHIGGWAINIETNALSWTDEVYQIHEVDMNYKPIVETAIAFYAPESRPIIQQAVQRAVDFGEAFDLELELITAKNNRLWVHSIGQAFHEAGKPKTVFGTFLDITERKQAEKQLQDAHDLLEQRVTERTAELTASKQQVEAIVNNNPAGIVLLSPDYHILSTNPTFNSLFLSQPGEHLNQSVFELIDKDDRRQVEEAIQPGSAKKLALPIVVRMQRHDGTFFDSELSIGYIPDGNFVCTINDITTRKQAELQMEQALVREKELNEIKSQFVSMASHEFRTPLATILASSETLAAYRHKMTEAQIGEKFVKIREQVDHLKGIMDDVLYLARMDARRTEFNPHLLDIDALIRTVIDEFQGRPGFSYQIDYHFDGSNAQVMLDNKLMRQILGNLISNAIKYSLPHKPIVVELKVSSNATVFSVADQGIGIPESDVPHLFESFHRGSNVGTISGTGLGLLISKESVELHGGTIEVASEIGIGTTITVTIPAVLHNPVVSNLD